MLGSHHELAIYMVVSLLVNFDRVQTSHLAKISKVVKDNKDKDQGFVRGTWQ
jgi:hypothetical protein